MNISKDEWIVRGRLELASVFTNFFTPHGRKPPLSFLVALGFRISSLFFSRNAHRIIPYQMQSQPSDNYKKQDFAFLASPPPPRQKSQLPVTTQLAFSAILSWAATVQPGSPAPVSPQRRPSISSTPGPSVAEEFDLTALGYTTVFVHLPKTPTTPSPYLREYNLRHNRVDIPMPAMEPAAPPKRKGMRRFRSLSILRPRGAAPKSKLTQATVSPAKTTFSAKPGKAKPKATQHQHGQAASPDLALVEICAASIAQRKRARYAHVRPPPPLAAELAMMQFTDGGALETHVRTVMERQARAAAGSSSRLNTGVADVYRDDKGGIWWDADEEMEYAHLLGGRTAQEVMKEGADALEGEWEAFDEDAEPLVAFLSHQPTSTSPVLDLPATTSALDLADTRRTSISTISSLDSDLDPQYLLPLPELEDARQTPTDDCALASRRIGGPALGALLALPARPGRTAGHLRKARSAFVGDEAMLGGNETRTAEASVRPRPKGIARRRPAPLTLATSNANTARAVVVVRRSGSVKSQRGAIGDAAVAAATTTVDTPPAAAPASTSYRPVRAAPPAPTLEPTIALPRIPSDSLRREFIEASFVPPPASAPSAPTATATPAPHPYAAAASSTSLLAPPPVTAPHSASRMGTPLPPSRAHTPASTSTSARAVVLGASDPQEQYDAYSRAGTPSSQLAIGTPKTSARFGVRALFGMRRRVD